MIRNINKHLKSQENAWNGLYELLTRHLNFDIEFGIAIIVLVAGAVLGLTAIEWIITLVSITAVLVAEAVNTAVEQLCDAITKDYNQNIKSAKDISAAAVLLIALTTMLVGIIIFVPKLIAIL